MPAPTPPDDITPFLTDPRRLPAANLRAAFQSQRGRLVVARLVRSLIWHARSAIVQGHEPPVDGNIRTLWYRFIKPVVAKLPEATEARLDPYRVMVRELSQMVVDRRLFDYADMGFVDENWENRRIGAGRPHVIVFAEKTGWIRFLRRVHVDWDVTVQALGGQPSALSSEYTARHVREALETAGYDGPVHLVGLVDWDPAGASLAAAYGAQLRAFGLAVGSTEIVVRPELLDPEARAALSRELPDRTLTRRWLADGGGVDGLARGLSAEAVPAAVVKAQVAAAVGRLAPESLGSGLAEREVEGAAWGGWGGGVSGVPVVAGSGLAEVAPRAAETLATGGRAVVASGSAVVGVVCPVAGSG